MFEFRLSFQQLQLVPVSFALQMLYLICVLMVVTLGYFLPLFRLLLPHHNPLCLRSPPQPHSGLPIVAW